VPPKREIDPNEASAIDRHTSHHPQALTNLKARTRLVAVKKSRSHGIAQQVRQLHCMSLQIAAETSCGMTGAESERAINHWPD